MVFYLTTWFPSAARARLVALFLAAVPLANVIGGPISGLILQMDGYRHLHGWQWLFLIEGAPSLLLGLLVLVWLPKGPAEAKWLSEEERAAIAGALAEEPQQHHTEMLPMFRDMRVWILSGIYFGPGGGAIRHQFLAAADRARDGVLDPRNDLRRGGALFRDDVRHGGLGPQQRCARRSASGTSPSPP